MDKNWRKPIRVTMYDGQILEGLPDGYTSELDNEPDGESIMILTNEGFSIELYTAEITDVELID